MLIRVKESIWLKYYMKLVHRVYYILPLHVHHCPATVFVVVSQKGIEIYLLDYHSVSAELHYTDTGYGHVVQHLQQTSSQQFYNLLYNKFTTNGQKFATSGHVEMLGTGIAMWQIVVQQVVELL